MVKSEKHDEEKEKEFRRQKLIAKIKLIGLISPGIIALVIVLVKFFTGVGEVELEILGLQTVIAAAKQRIAVLNQSVELQRIMGELAKEDTTDEQTVATTSETETEEAK